jgi:hypothetical protein
MRTALPTRHRCVNGAQDRPLTRARTAPISFQPIIQLAKATLNGPEADRYFMAQFQYKRFAGLLLLYPG